MYTIKQAALRSGLSIPTIRVWERRYGVVVPARTASGYRLYDEAALDRLIAMRHLVEVEGVRPSQAAEQVRDAGPDLAALVERGRRDVALPGLPPVSDAPDGAVAAFRDAARRMDIGTMERLLDETFAAERFEAAVTRVVFPALRAIGDDWANGTIDVAMEHAASETVRRRLARYFDAAAVSVAKTSVVVGLPPGAHHEIGAQAFAVAARRRGLGVIYLGADVPVASWVRAMETTGASVAVLAVLGADDVIAAGEVVEALAASPARPVVAVGGRRAPALSERRGVVVLPDAVDAAVERTRELIRPGR